MSDNNLAPNWIPDASTLGARLALVRWRMGWNMKEAERECNLTQNSWSKWEDGVSPRNYIEVINRIVLRTGVNKVWLMDGTGSPESPEPETKDYGSHVLAGVTEIADYFRDRPVAERDAVVTEIGAGA